MWLPGPASMTTFFPPFGQNQIENLVNFAVNVNPVAFSARAFFLVFPDQAAPLGTVVDQLLRGGLAPDNLFDPSRTPSRPFVIGDRVQSASRSIPTSRLFGAYILAFVPGTEGSINVWDGGFVTYDPLSELEPQSLAQFR